MDYIDCLRDAIKKLHHCDSTYRESVPVTETFQGKIVWAGTVEVFDLIGHPNAERCYAWAHKEGRNDEGTRFVTVLEIPPIDTPKKAVRASIVDSFRR